MSALGFLDLSTEWITKKIEEDREEQKILERKLTEDIQCCLANIHIGVHGAITLSGSVLGYLDDAENNLGKIQSLESEIMKLLQILIQKIAPHLDNHLLNALLDSEEKKVEMIKKEMQEIGCFLISASRK